MKTRSKKILKWTGTILFFSLAFIVLSYARTTRLTDTLINTTGSLFTSGYNVTEYIEKNISSDADKLDSYDSTYFFPLNDTIDNITAGYYHGSGKYLTDVNYTRAATVVVAASDSKDKNRADFICNGTADDVTIESAIASLPSGGGRVLLMEGTFNLSADIDIDYDNVVLEGQGKPTQLYLRGSFSTPIDGNSPYITIKNLFINNGSVGAIAVDLKEHSTVESIMTHGFTTAVSIGGSDCIIKGIVANESRGGIFVAGYDRAIVTENIIYNPPGWEAEAILFLLSNDGVISSNIIEHGTIHLETANRINVVYNIIYDAIGHSDHETSIDIEGDNNIISGNTIKGAKYKGISSSGENNVISNNNIIESNYSGIEVWYKNNNIITGNIILDCDYSDTGNYDGIEIKSDRNIIAENRIDCGRVAINLSSTADNNTVMTNTLIGATLNITGCDINDNVCFNNIWGSSYIGYTGDEHQFVIEDVLMGEWSSSLLNITTGDFAVDTDTLFVDESLDRVGIGTSAPSVPLDVVGNIETTGNVTGHYLFGNVGNLTDTNASTICSGSDVLLGNGSCVANYDYNSSDETFSVVDNSTFKKHTETIIWGNLSSWNLSSAWTGLLNWANLTAYNLNVAWTGSLNWGNITGFDLNEAWANTLGGGNITSLVWTKLTGYDLNVAWTNALHGGNITGDSLTGTQIDESSLTAQSGWYNTTEQVEDITGGMVSGNTETRITVDYQDADGTLDFVVTDMSNTSAQAIASTHTTYVNITGDTMTGNLTFGTTEGIKSGGNYTYFNGTCWIMQGPTSTLEVC